MRLTILGLAIAAAVMAGPGEAQAGKLAGVTMPDTITVAGKPLVLNGMGLREATFLKIDVYVGGLYLEHTSSNPAAIIAADEVKQLVLRFVRNVDRDDIIEAWNAGFAGNATVPVATLRQPINRLNGWMPKFSDGDTLVFSYVPGEGVAVEINRVRKGVIKDASFASSLFAIWLGPKPPTQDVKRGLLGNHPQARRDTR
jgi:hypothetical protein